LVQVDTNEGRDAVSVIRSFAIRNFKAIGERQATVVFAPVTLLFGPNSAGKSSLIQALHYAYEILNRDNPDADRTLLGGRAIELGGFRNMVHQRDVARRIELCFELDLSRTDLPTYRVDYVTSYAAVSDWATGVEVASVKLVIAWSDDIDRPYVETVQVSFDNGVAVTISYSPRGKDSFLHFYGGSSKDPGGDRSSSEDAMCRLLSSLLPEVISDTYLDQQPGRPPCIAGVAVGGVREALPRRGKPLEFPGALWRSSENTPEHREFTEQLSSLAVGPLDLLRDALGKLIYVGPLREVPERHIQPARSPDPSRWSMGLAAWDLLAADPAGLIERANQWLAGRDHFNSGYHIEAECYREIRSDSPLGVALSGGLVLDAEQSRSWYEQLPAHRRVRLVDDGKNVALSPQDLGIGLSQTIPILVAALHAHDTMVLVEQPELHIHPAMQVELGDLFIEAAHQNELCFLIETHSEHILLRILRRIRETGDGEVPPGEPECRKEQVAVYFIEPDSENRDARVSRLRIADDGNFVDRWPHGFFEERAEELF
jgi:hypothetical protein